MANKIVMIHGYSDEGESFRPWVQRFRAQGHDVQSIRIANYKTLTNEVSIRDIAEGFDRALQLNTGLGEDEPFDAIVHSTGMLVIRAWLTAYRQRRGRLKHLIGLAPASFGSPLAHKGRSWLGSLFKGNKDVGGPDFLEAGNLVLDGLELGSRFTWDLAHADLLQASPDDPPFYGSDNDTPYVFVFCGTEGYSGIRHFVKEPGTDGTVRLAGCALNTRKITLDLTKDPGLTQIDDRVQIQPWRNVRIPLTPIAGFNHGSILREPNDALFALVEKALAVSTEQEYSQWLMDTEPLRAVDGREAWQQFIVRATDERGDPITDYNVQLFAREPGSTEEALAFDTDVHSYKGDESLRCFHVRLDDVDLNALTELWLRFSVSSGTELVGYYGTIGSSPADQAIATAQRPVGWWEGRLNITRLLTDDEVKFFYPFTTTLAELRLNREPMPIDRNDANQVLDWVEFS